MSEYFPPENDMERSLSFEKLMEVATAQKDAIEAEARDRDIDRSLSFRNFLDQASPS